MNYIIVSTYTLGETTKTVNKLLNTGYICQGGVNITHVDGSTIIISQAMIKKEH